MFIHKPKKARKSETREIWRQASWLPHPAKKKTSVLGRDFRESPTKKPFTFLSKTKARMPNFTVSPSAKEKWWKNVRISDSDPYIRGAWRICPPWTPRRCAESFSKVCWRIDAKGRTGMLRAVSWDMLSNLWIRTPSVATRLPINVFRVLHSL